MPDDIAIFRFSDLPDLTTSEGTFKQEQVAFTFGRRSNTVSGILKLVQMVVKMLLTSPGTDHFAVQTGTILRGLVKKGVTESSAQLLKMDIMVSIQDLERQIQDAQAGQPIPDDEILQELQISRVEFLPESSEWQIEISVLSQAGEGVSFNLSPYLKGN